jgi:hypothetical protein
MTPVNGSAVPSPVLAHENAQTFPKGVPASLLDRRVRRQVRFDQSRVLLAPMSMSRVLNAASVGIEHVFEMLALAHYRFRPRPTFASTTSQIIAAMSGPPNCAIWRMPVGEVTLISVR